MYSLVIKPRAILMTKEAYNWYEEQKEGLGEEFLKDLDIHYNKLQSHPEYFGKIKNTFRKISLKRFPYIIVFEIIRNEVVVFAVFRTKRNPKLRFRD